MGPPIVNEKQFPHRSLQTENEFHLSGLYGHLAAKYEYFVPQCYPTKDYPDPCQSHHLSHEFLDQFHIQPVYVFPF